MELKELAGDQDLFDVLKKQKKGKHKSKVPKQKIVSKQSPTDVFEFINKKLSGKKGISYTLFFKSYKTLK